MLFITDEDVRQILYFAALSAANKLGVESAEFKSLSQLVTDIRTKHHSLAAALDSYMYAYHEWFDFHVKLDDQGKQGHLDTEEEQELFRLIDQRQQTRDAFIRTLAGVTVTPQ